MPATRIPRRYEEDARRRLREADAPRTERRYYAPGTGHGWTLDPEQAQAWAFHRARVLGPDKVAVVIFRDVTLSAWSVLYEHPGTQSP